MAGCLEKLELLTFNNVRAEKKYTNCNCKILEVASYSNLNNYRGSAVRDIRTPLVDSN